MLAAAGEGDSMNKTWHAKNRIAEGDARRTNRVAHGAPKELQVPQSTEEPYAIFQVSQAEMTKF